MKMQRNKGKEASTYVNDASKPIWESDDKAEITPHHGGNGCACLSSLSGSGKNAVEIFIP